MHRYVSLVYPLLRIGLQMSMLKPLVAARGMDPELRSKEIKAEYMAQVFWYMKTYLSSLGLDPLL
jgi:hypothetical protein